MKPRTAHQSVRTTYRTQKSSVNPYYVDDTAFTLADILRARVSDAPSVGH